jgi:hypothetical protein
VASTSGPGSKPPLAPILDGFGRPDGKRDAALSEYGKQLENVDLEVLDEFEEDPEETARRAAGKSEAAVAQAALAAKLSAKTDGSADGRSSLEPISDDTHRHRRIPTQPPSALALDLDPQAGNWQAHAPASPPASQPSASQSSAPSKAPGLATRQSPTPVRRGLFGADRITNMLACTAVGLVLMIFPAKQLARSYEVSKVQPLLEDLEGAVDHPLGVQAGLVAAPEKIAAQIHEGREKVRRRYMAIWLLVGLPIGLGLGFAPRPGD